MSKIVTLPGSNVFLLLQRAQWTKNHIITRRQAYRKATSVGSKTLENIEAGTEGKLENGHLIVQSGKGDQL